MKLNAARFQKELIYKREADAASILADLDQIRALDAETEKQQRKWLIITLLSVLVGGALAVLSAANDLATLAAMVGLVAVVGFVVGLVTYLRYRRCNVDNRRYELVAQLLGLLRVDMPRDQVVQTALDFRQPNHGSKFTGKGTAGTWDVRYFRDPWLQLAGRLADGTSFELQQTDLLQARSKTKRSRSGKMKHKSKKKHGFEAELKLRFKPTKYRHMAKLQSDAEQAVQLPPGVMLKRLKHSDRDMTLRVAGKGTWMVMPRNGKAIGEGFEGTRTLSLLFLSLFQILNLSKAMDKSATSGESTNGESA